MQRGDLLQAGRALDNHQCGRLQTAADKVFEKRPPGGLVLPAHIFDRQKDLLAVVSHTQGNKQRNRRRFLVHPNTHHRAVEDEAHDRLGSERAGLPGIPIALDLAPGPADRVLADRPAKHRRQRPANPARVGSGKIGTSNQRLGLFRAPLVGRDRRVLPLERPASCRFQPGSRYPHRQWPKCSRQLPLSVAMTVTAHAGPLSSIRPFFDQSTLVTLARQSSIKFGFQDFLNEAANAPPHSSLQWIEPIFPKKKRCIGRIGQLFRVNRFHGVISIGAPTPNLLVEQAGDYATFEFQPPRRHHRLMQPNLLVASKASPFGRTGRINSFTLCSTHSAGSKSSDEFALRLAWTLKRIRTELDIFLLSDRLAQRSPADGHVPHSTQRSQVDGT